MGISPISVVKEMTKDIRDKSDVECKFYESAEDVPDPRELSSLKKNTNGIWWSVIWKTKTHLNRIISEEDTFDLSWLFLFSPKLFQAPTHKTII